MLECKLAGLGDCEAAAEHFYTINLFLLLDFFDNIFFSLWKNKTL